MTIDYTPELGRLLAYVSRVAVAIRVNCTSSHDTQAIRDAWWLADSIHNFNRINDAITTGPAATIEMCDFFIESYMHEGNRRGHSRLEEGVRIFQAIREKAVLVASDEAAASHLSIKERGLRVADRYTSGPDPLVKRLLSKVKPNPPQ